MHRNAPLTPEGRRRLVELIESGWTVAAAAESMQSSRQWVHKWWRRWGLLHSEMTSDLWPEGVVGATCTARAIIGRVAFPSMNGEP